MDNMNDIESAFDQIKLALLISDLNELDTDLLKGIGRHIDRTIAERDETLHLLHTKNKDKPNIVCDSINIKLMGVECKDNDGSNVTIPFVKIFMMSETSKEEFEKDKFKDEYVRPAQYKKKE